MALIRIPLSEDRHLLQPFLANKNTIEMIIDHSKIGPGICLLPTVPLWCFFSARK